MGEHVLGDDDDGADPIEMKIAKKKLHENYGGRSFDNDIAILTLEDDLPSFDEKIAPVCLPESKQSYVNKTPFVAGWGTTKFRGRQSNRLMETFLSVSSNKECQQKFKSVSKVSIQDTKICAVDRAGVSDACQGDSGGPLMVQEGPVDTGRWHLIGIVSFGYRCGIRGFPGVYTRVTHFRDWIESNLN